MDMIKTRVMDYNETVMNILGRAGSVFRALTARLAACRRGAAAVEFALIIPVLSVGVIGVANYGLVVFDKMEMVSTLRAGAQLAIYNRSNTTSTQTDAIKQAVVDSASTGLGLSTAEVTATESYLCDDGTSINDPSSQTCVDKEPVQYYMTVAITNKNFPLLIAGSIDLSGTVKVRTK